MSKSQVVAKSSDFKIEKIPLGPYGTNAYAAVCLKTHDSVVVDAPADASTILETLKGTNLKYILLTHSHMDHIGALADLRSQKIPLAAHSDDSASLPSPADIILKDGSKIRCGRLELDVLHTPGHTKGSLCFKMEEILFSGDTLFPGGPGKTRSPAAFKEIIASITKKIFMLPDDTKVFPGHGETTVLKKEKEAYKKFASRSHDPNLCGDVTWLSS